MNHAPFLTGITSNLITTARLKTHLLTSGADSGTPVIFIHGNIVSAPYWAETMLALPPKFRAIAPDMRGFGQSEGKAVDATRGLRDFSDDLHSLVEALGLAGNSHPLHLVGWSMGGGIVMQYAIDHPALVGSVVLIDPISPYGFGGTKDTAGTPCWPDYAGSGAGSVNPEFLQRLATGDRTADTDFSPRRILRDHLFKPTFRASPEREEIYVSGMLTTQVGESNYPGDLAASTHWPGIAPGTQGVVNAMSPKYLDLSDFAAIRPQPDVLWLRGESDIIVSDTSAYDFGYLGQIGLIPGWPGPAIYPPQPMVAQTRAVFETYQANGGRYREEVIANAGHSPLIEQPEVVQKLLIEFLK
ncbi:MAG: alpha/beta hydrolase [Anaerolineales bacterium]|nr:alpha/beta hydrolase [Anaerolineales bacterium]